jgi:hypothetical protein
MRYFILLLAMIIVGCAGTKEPVKDALPPEEKSLYDESFDPMSLNDDDIVINPQSKNTAPASDNNSALPVKNENIRRQMSGFRVQILATSNIETASLTEQEASDRFDKLGQKTYLLFEAPLYKIRLGDCKTRQEAEQLREQALNFGYSGAFIVKTKITVEP